MDDLLYLIHVLCSFLRSGLISGLSGFVKMFVGDDELATIIDSLSLPSTKVSLVNQA